VKCPYCASLETRVVDSRLNQTAEITRRRRECATCEGRFTTYERVEEVMPVIIKKDGRREPFSREKMMSGIRKATQKRPITTEKIEATIDQIERRIQSYGLKEMPAKTVGQMVMAALHKLDKVAYVRFSSVYREFKDVEEFVSELQVLPSDPEDPASLVFPFLGESETTV
jgi:transcriptional repressor NrdR